MRLRNRITDDIPVFFKLWFAFCAIAAVTITCVAIYLAVTLVMDPASAGRAAGSIVKAFNEASQ